MSSFTELRDQAVAAGVFRVGMSEDDLRTALDEHNNKEGDTVNEDTVTPVDDTADDTANVDDTEGAQVDDLADYRDDEGNLIDPPTLPEYERRMHEAQSLADEDMIADVQEDYTEARENFLRRKIARQREREERAKDES